MILSTLSVTEETYRTRMRDTQYDREKGCRWLALIRSHGMQWLKPQERATEEIVELIWMEQFMSVLPPSAQNWVMRYQPHTLEEAVKIMESYEVVEKVNPQGSAQQGEIWKRGGAPRGRPGGANAPPQHSRQAVKARGRRGRQQLRWKKPPGLVCRLLHMPPAVREPAPRQTEQPSS